MRHGLDQPPVDVKGVTDQLLAVAGDAAAADGDTVTAQAVYFGELFLHDARPDCPGWSRSRRTESRPSLRHQHQLGGGGAAVDAKDRHRRCSPPGIPPWQVARLWRSQNASVLLLGCRTAARVCAVVGMARQRFLHVSEQSVHVGFPVLPGGVQCRAQRDRQPTVFREQCVFVIQLQRLPGMPRAVPDSSTGDRPGT